LDKGRYYYLNKALEAIPEKYKDLKKMPLTAQEREKILRGQSMVRIFLDRQRKDKGGK